MSDTPYSKFAQQRSHDDAKSLAEFGKTLLQMVIGINGLAATSLITLVTAKQLSINITVNFLIAAIICYLLEVVSGMLSSVFLYKSRQYWTMKWEQSAYPNIGCAKEFQKRGERWNRWTLRTSIAGLVFFVLGGGSAVLALC